MLNNKTDFEVICRLATVKEFAKNIKCGNITLTLDIKDGNFVKIRFNNYIQDLKNNK
jgi:hypothetical protein